MCVSHLLTVVCVCWCLRANPSGLSTMSAGSYNYNYIFKYIIIGGECQPPFMCPKRRTRLPTHPSSLEFFFLLCPPAQANPSKMPSAAQYDLAHPTRTRALAHVVVLNGCADALAIPFLRHGCWKVVSAASVHREEVYVDPCPPLVRARALPHVTPQR